MCCRAKQQQVTGQSAQICTACEQYNIHALGLMLKLDLNPCSGARTSAALVSIVMSQQAADLTTDDYPLVADDQPLHNTHQITNVEPLMARSRTAPVLNPNPHPPQTPLTRSRMLSP